jgi:hypothetical protein
MREQKNSFLDEALGWIIGVPIVAALLILFSPLLLFFFFVKGPILIFKKNSFLKRHEGKQILCTSPGRKLHVFHSAYRSDILSLGIDDIVVFDATKPNNKYDGFEWDPLIFRGPGFPLLISISGGKIFQQSLKSEFSGYFKKEIDWVQLKGCIKRKVDGKSY